MINPQGISTQLCRSSKEHFSIFQLIVFVSWLATVLVQSHCSYQLCDISDKPSLLYLPSTKVSLVTMRAVAVLCEDLHFVITVAMA